MISRAFGNTGLQVSAVGLGAGHLDGLPEREATALLEGALALGITLFDAARSYGEDALARALSPRRDAFVLSTKGGYGVEGVPDWTPEVLHAGVERALRTLRTDRIDVFHLHSCPLETLRREELLRACEALATSGKVRVVAYSGENEALAFAVRCGVFGSVQTSVNLFDQRGLSAPIPEAAAKGLGVIGKRPLGNAPWRFAEEPHGHYAQVYWRRMKAMGLDPAPLTWPELALRFAAHASGVSSVIVGTSSLPHLRESVAAVAQGPLPGEVRARVEAAFAPHAAGWEGQV